MRTAFEREGDIRSVDLLAAFATLWRERGSGVLRFSGAGESIRFDLLDGDVVRVVASDAGFDAIEVLLRAGKIDEAALDRRRIPSGKDRALAAREAGVLTERDWRWGERIRAVEILAHLVAWLEGSYAFDSSARPEKGELAVGIHRLILELFLRSRDRAFVHHALPAVDARLQRAADFDEKFGTLGLTPDALRVAVAIDGRSTAAEISRRTPPDPFSVEKLLAALATLGLLHPEYAAELPKAVPEQPPEPVPLPVAEIEAPAPSPEPPPAPEAPADPVLPEEPEEKLRIDLPLAAPVEPSEPAAVAWEPVVAEPMDQPLDVAGAEIPSAERRSIPIAVWVLLVLAIAVGALLLSRSRETGSAAVEPPRAATPVATAAPGSIPTVAAETTAPVPAAIAPLPPTRPPGTPSPVPPTPSPSPRPRPTLTAVPTAAPTEPALPSAAPAGPGRPGAARSREDWLALGERDRVLARQQPGARFTIQLELVCELPSLAEAWRFDREGQMWLSSADHHGRPCFRVFWGRYPDLEAARRAKSSVPRFFFTRSNNPTVVSMGPALLP